MIWARLLNRLGPQGVLKLMSDKDFNRKARTPALAGGAREVRKENRLIFAFSALLAVSLTKNQETRLDFEKALLRSGAAFHQKVFIALLWVSLI